MDLQTAANMLDPSGMNAAWGAQDLALPVRGVRRLQWQVIKEDNTPAAMPLSIANLVLTFIDVLIASFARVKIGEPIV